MVCKHLNLTRRKCFLKYYSDLHFYSPTKMLFPFQKQIASRTLVIWHWLYIILEHRDMGDVVKWLTCSYRRSLIICQYGRRQIASSSHSFLVIRGWICLEFETTLIDLLLSSNIRMKKWTPDQYIYNEIYNKYKSKLLLNNFICQALRIFNHKILLFCYSPNAFSA